MILLLYVRTPSHDNWNCGELRRLALTSETLTWDPTTTFYEEEQEKAMTDHAGHVLDRTVLRGQNTTLVISALASSAETAADVMDDDNFYRMLYPTIL